MSKKRGLNVEAGQILSIKKGELMIPSSAMVFDASVSMRSYLSSHHLWAAHHFAELAGKIETEHKGKSAFNIEHRAYVMNAILSSVSFLETCINEIFQDASDGQSSYIQPLNENTQQLLGTYWKSVMKENRRDNLSILAKYEAALNLDKKDQFTKGENLYQNVDLVIKLRNELIHFKPSTLSSHDVDENNFKNKLKGKFSLNVLMENSGNPFFPDKCLGYGCAKWAVEACKDFTNAFFSKLGIKPNYQVVNIPPFLSA